MTECAYCKDTIKTWRYWGGFIQKEKDTFVFQFCSLTCMNKYLAENADNTFEIIWIKRYDG